MKILICAAGSAGHIYPAVSLAKSLRQSSPETKVIFLTTARDVQREYFHKLACPVVCFEIDALPKRENRNYLILCLKISGFLIKFIIETFKTLEFIAGEKPDVVVGFGGIISVPAIISAKLLNIPSLIHEQNVKLGAANRFLSKVAAKIALGFESTGKDLSGNNFVFTGNPLAIGLTRKDRIRAREDLGLDKDKFTILVFGGSQGSEFLNKAFFAAISGFSAVEQERLQIVHIAGRQAKDAVLKDYRKLPVSSLVLDYAFDMSSYYSAADLVICRAGAAAINELCFFARASVLVPYPHAQAHQRSNARFLSERDAAVLIEQNEDCQKNLYNIISRLKDERSLLDNMSASAGKLFRPDAAVALANLVFALAKKK